MTTPLTPVFVWRTSAPPPYYLGGACKYCHSSLQTRILEEDELDSELRTLFSHQMDTWIRFRRNGEPLDEYDDFWEICQPLKGFCDRCGWWLNFLSHANVGPDRTCAAALLQFDINDTNLAIPEVLSHLSKRFSDVYSMSSRRFEEVIADIYRNMGWRVSLTGQTRDGGVDLYCLRADSGEACIVECKRYAQSKTVGIDVVDRLVGVSYRLGISQAEIVTSSRFTKPAASAAAMAAERSFQMNLVDAHELLRLLDVYSDPSLTINDINAIF